MLRDKTVEEKREWLEKEERGWGTERNKDKDFFFLFI